MCSNCLFPNVQRTILKPKSNILRITKNVNNEEDIHELQSIHTQSPKELVTLGCEGPELDLCGILKELSKENVKIEKSVPVENETDSRRGNF